MNQVAPNLIVLDLRLPDMTGLEVRRLLRKAGKRQPILMLTALDEEMEGVGRREKPSSEPEAPRKG